MGWLGHWRPTLLPVNLADLRSFHRFGGLYPNDHHRSMCLHISSSLGWSIHDTCDTHNTTFSGVTMTANVMWNFASLPGGRGLAGTS